MALGQVRHPAPSTSTSQPVPAPNSEASETDVVYGKVNGTTLRLDVYRPETPAQQLAPAVILIHGGGWMSFDKSTMSRMARWLSGNGFVAFAIDYRLLQLTENQHPANQWPAQLDDAQRAVRWVRANAAKYGVDPARIGAFGHSAGAQMASLLGELDTRDNRDASLAAYSSRVQAVVDVSGPSDFTNRHDADGDKFMAQLFGSRLEEDPKTWRAASPVFNIDKHTSPFLIVHGTHDEEVPIAQAEEFDAALEKAGISVKFIKVDDGHAFRSDEARRELAIETVAFFNEKLKTAQPNAAP